MDTRSAMLARFGQDLWVADGGLETELVFHDGRDLPLFASFPLVMDDEGRARLDRYFAGYADAAARLGMGFGLDTVTWRASHGWGAQMGIDAAGMEAVNRAAVALARDFRGRRGGRFVVNGLIGSMGDGYVAGTMTAAAAEAYHAPQIRALAAAGAEMGTVMTMTTAAEAIGVTRAAGAARLPFVTGLTLETDGRLPSGETLAEAIAAVDTATDGWPMWYLINCAHPDHFRHILRGDWTHRIGAVRANASRLSHAELDACTTLDAGDPAEFGRLCADLRTLLPGLRVLGGCCGTDLRHIAAVGAACCGRRAA